VCPDFRSLGAGIFPALTLGATGIVKQGNRVQSGPGFRADCDGGGAAGDDDTYGGSGCAVRAVNQVWPPDVLSMGNR